MFSISNLKLGAVPGLVVASLCFALMADKTMAAGKNCFPKVDSGQPQYLIGYGTLLQEAARERKLKKSEVEVPVWVKGFERGWFTRLKMKAPYRTVLGVIEKPGESFNGLLISSSQSQIGHMDGSSATLCRVQVHHDQISSMISEKLPEKGQFWMYVVKKDSKARPAANYPIMQSDIDVFLTGCLEQAEEFKLPGYAPDCIKYTSNWSQHWNYDRRSPSDGKLVQNKRTQIDDLLEKLENNLYDKVRAE